MSSRRQIREATIQLLYARQADPSPSHEEHHWSLIHHADLRTLDRAKVKLLAHLQQGRPAQVSKLQNAAVDSTTAIEAADPTGKCVRLFQNHLKAETQYCGKLEALPRLTKADTGNWQNDLHSILKLSQDLPSSRKDILSASEDFPPVQKETLERILNKLDEFDKRARQLISPLQHPEQRELSHLRDTQEKLNTLQATAIKLAEKVEIEQEKIDDLLDHAATNFDLHRFSKVDLNILRLAAWEILHDEDVPDAVAIDEAVEIARRFGATESAPFVNALLDKISKNKS